MKTRVKLTFPQELIQEPVIFAMAKRYDIMPNIRRARVTETVGEVVLELEGSEENINSGIEYMKLKGVDIYQASRHFADGNLTTIDMSKAIAPPTYKSKLETLGYRIDIEAMEKMLGVKVIPTVSTKKTGFDELKKTIPAKHGHR